MLNNCKVLIVVASLAFSCAYLTAVKAGASLDSKLTSYKKVLGIRGSLSSVGSDTLANLMTFWAEEFNAIYPQVKIQIQAAGSSTAPPALIHATAQFGPMSRKMKDKEIQAFQKQYKYSPTAIPVAIDVLAVFVHKDNPLNELSLVQVDAIFSATRKCGYKKQISHWHQLGLSGSFKKRKIQLFGRNSVSGTYGYFKKKALCKGDFLNAVNEQPGSAAVVQSVATSINAIGYSGIGYKVSNVKALALSKNGTKYIAANNENALNGKYPLARYLYIYINKPPQKKLSPLMREFLKMVLSKQGQKIVVKDGYIPLPYKIVAKYLKDL